MSECFKAVPSILPSKHSSILTVSYNKHDVLPNRVLQDGEIADLEASIRALQQERKEVDQRQCLLKNKHLECYQKCQKCEKKRELVIRKIDQLKV